MTLKEQAPDFRDVLFHPEAFSTLVEERLKLKDEIENANARIKEIDDLIMEQLADAGQPKVQYGDVPVGLVESSRSNLSKEKLVELGVPVGIINQATTVVRFTFVRVGTPKEKSRG